MKLRINNTLFFKTDIVLETRWNKVAILMFEGRCVLGEGERGGLSGYPATRPEKFLTEALEMVI